MEITHGGNIFAVAREKDWDWREVLDLSESINPLGPAPGVRQSLLNELDRIGHYPEQTPHLLVEKLAQRWQMEPEQILLGNGATELIHFTARMWSKETATLAVPVFSEFHRAHPVANKVPWNEPEDWPERGLMIFTQPNSPIGQTVAEERLKQYLRGTANPVIVDESFIEFTDAKSMMPLIGVRPNLFVLRSMTKFYALPGLRVGALVGDAENLEALRVKREPWQINVLAEAAALASLDDIDYAARTRELVAEEREWMWARLSKVPTITPIRTEANFMLIYLASGAEDLVNFLARQKVLVRNCTGWPGIEGEAIRIAIRQRPDNERFVALLRRYMTGSE
jgi:threonine-phosphate decarboxylase